MVSRGGLGRKKKPGKGPAQAKELTWDEVCEIAFGALGLSEREFYSMTWRAFLLKQRGYNSQLINDRKYQRLLTWNVCRMLSDPKKKFPPLHKFIKFDDETPGNSIGMTPEERRAQMEHNRQFKKK